MKANGRLDLISGDACCCCEVKTKQKKLGTRSCHRQHMSVQSGCRALERGNGNRGDAVQVCAVQSKRHHKNIENTHTANKMTGS